MDKQRMFELANETAVVMYRLKIPLRFNLGHELPTLTLDDGNGQRFHSPTSPTIALGPYEYPYQHVNPIIFVSQETLDGVNNPEDRSYKYWCSVVVHELTHFLQLVKLKRGTNDEGYIKQTSTNFPQYVAQPKELQAYATQAYYLYHLDQEVPQGTPIDERYYKLLCNRLFADYPQVFKNYQFSI